MIIEAVGLPATQAQAVAAAKKGAQVLMFGVGPQEAHFEMNTYDIYKKQLTIQGSFINPLTFKDAISLLESGKMNVAPLISHELGLRRSPGLPRRQDPGRLQGRRQGRRVVSALCRLLSLRGAGGGAD